MEPRTPHPTIKPVLRLQMPSSCALTSPSPSVGSSSYFPGTPGTRFGVSKVQPPAHPISSLTPAPCCPPPTPIKLFKKQL